MFRHGAVPHGTNRHESSLGSIAIFHHLHAPFPPVHDDPVVSTAGVRRHFLPRRRAQIHPRITLRLANRQLREVIHLVSRRHATRDARCPPEYEDIHLGDGRGVAKGSETELAPSEGDHTFQRVSRHLAQANRLPRILKHQAALGLVDTSVKIYPSERRQIENARIELLQHPSPTHAAVHEQEVSANHVGTSPVPSYGGEFFIL